MRNRYKFSELSEQAKIIAAREYLEGLKETRNTDDLPTIAECAEFCLDTDNDVFYTSQGYLIEEEEVQNGE